jgi:hypothetical protein
MTEFFLLELPGEDLALEGGDRAHTRGNVLEDCGSQGVDLVGRSHLVPIAAVKALDVELRLVRVSGALDLNTAPLDVVRKAATADEGIMRRHTLVLRPWLPMVPIVRVVNARLHRVILKVSIVVRREDQMRAAHTTLIVLGVLIEWCGRKLTLGLCE